LKNTIADNKRFTKPPIAKLPNWRYFFEILAKLGLNHENQARIHEWGAASLENFIFGMIRVYSKNSWFKCAVLGHPIRIGSLIFYELKMSEI
jgi:hypothetical protein